MSGRTVPKILLWRTDYGWEHRLPPGFDRCGILDMMALPLPRPRAGKTVRVFAGVLPRGGGPILVRNAQRMLAWKRMRDRGDPIPEIARLARGRRLALQCRFPRHVRELAGGLEAEGVRTSLLQASEGGVLPPPYRAIDPGGEEAGLHVALEWETALAAARGGQIIVELGRLLAANSPAGLVDLSRALGVTRGAAGSYLRWMADVSLVRKGEGGFELAHPLLALRFGGTSAPDRAGPQDEERETPPRPPGGFFDPSLD